MIYVQAANQISIQQPFSEEWLDQAIQYKEGGHVCAIDPDFKPYVSPGEGRRMGKLLKRALATSLHTLRQCGVERPEAIVTGTGLGSVESTEAFLLDMCRNGEQLLKPTHFMQSTHNTIGSLVAIQTKCHGYNATYSHKQISFESALYDACLQLQAGDISNALVLGQDATSLYQYHLWRLSGYTDGITVPCGDASVAAFLTTDPTPGYLCRLTDVELLHQPTVQDWKQLLSRYPLGEDTLVVCGYNGQPANDALYTDWFRQLNLPAVKQTEYKSIFGESSSASALGFYSAVHQLHARSFTQIVLLNLTPDGDAAITFLAK